MSILGSLSSEQFLAEYWQKKPLLVRNALPDFQSPLSADELAGLSLEEQVESRLIIGTDSRPWQLQQGPFEPDVFNSLPDKDWTLLVQGVDQWVPEVRALIDQVDFLPRWRIDDIMVSYAATGGSVGPHFDYYDVFLIQGAGTRLWQLDGFCDEQSPLLGGTPLKILRQFDAKQQWLLEPGDMLYLPPCLAHHGIAQDDQCMTFSVGFRSPTTAEIFNDLALELLSHSDFSHQYLQDPILNNVSDRDRLEPAYLQQIQQQMQAVLSDEQLLEDWFARYMTRPKSDQDIDEDLADYDSDDLSRAIHNGNIRELAPNSRVIKTAKGLYINGEKLD